VIKSLACPTNLTWPIGDGRFIGETKATFAINGWEQKMKKFTSALIALGFAAFSQPGLAQGATAGVSEAARPAAAIVEAFHAALVRGDAAAARALLADNVLIFEAGSVERSAAEYGGHHMPGDMAFAKAVPGIVTNRSGDSDGNTAWIASEGRTTGNYKGKPVDRLSTETMVLVRMGDAWRIRHIHWSSRAAKK
jgi:ketosteroid isomerase-like protein